MGIVGLLGKPHDFYIMQKSSFLGANHYWSHDFSLIILLIPRLLSACIQGNYIYMCLCQCWTHPLGKDKASTHGDTAHFLQCPPKITHPTHQWDKVETVVLSITSQGQVTIYSWPCCGWNTEKMEWVYPTD